MCIDSEKRLTKTVAAGPIIPANYDNKYIVNEGLSTIYIYQTMMTCNSKLLL